MTSAKERRAKHQAACEAFQQAIDATVVYLDVPNEDGFSWEVRMPNQEYDAYLARLRSLRAQAEKAEEAEADELAVDLFLYESE